MADLIITNGDTAVDVLTAAGLPGRMLPWRDVLHEGPLLRTETPEGFSDIRASYLSARFGLPYGEVRADFVARDAVVAAHGLFDRVAIWIEHDLYDQLQLVHCLATLAALGRTEGVSLVQADDFLGTQQPETVLRFADLAVPVTPAMFQTATAAWSALTASTPAAVAARLALPAEGFPYLRGALLRFLEELPAPGSGLSRTEATIVEEVGRYRMTARDLFPLVAAAEDAVFMGDWSVFRTLDDLAGPPRPLIAGPVTDYPCRGDAMAVEAYFAAPLALTRFGADVVAGRADRVAAAGIDRWWAGVHLKGTECWRWERAARRLIAPAG